jgi:enterochelin esterase-like enzyme
MMADETQWIRVGLPTIADKLISRGEIPPFIVVMPYDPSWNQPTEFPFDQSITQDLVPYVDAQFRTLADRSHRALGGVSRGSGWAIHLGLTHPEMFSAIGAHSMVVFSSDWMQIKGWLAAIQRPSLPRLYIDISVNDSALWTAKQLEITLNDASIPHEFHLNNGFHDENYWAANIGDYLRWYSQGWVDTSVIPSENP